MLVKLTECDQKDSVIDYQAAYITSLQKVSATKDSTIYNRDSMMYEYRGEVKTFKTEVKLLKEQVKTLTTISKWDKVLEVGLVIIVVLSLL